MNKKIYPLLLIALLIFLSIKHTCFFILDDIPVIDHEFQATGQTAVDSYHELKDSRMGAWASQFFAYNGRRQPEMIGRLMGLACYLPGLSRLAMRQVNLVFYLLLVCCTYFIAKKLWGQRTAFWSAFMTSSLPLIISHSRRGDLHFFETALFTTAILMFMRSDLFKKALPSIFFGLFIGLTLHTHETSLIYFCIIYSLCGALIISQGNAVQKRNLLFSFLLTSVFFLAFYPPAFLNPASSQAMRLYPRDPGLSGQPAVFTAFQKFLGEFQEGFGRPNFYAALFAFFYFIFLRVKTPAARKLNSLTVLLVLLIIIPFTAIVCGSIFFKEVDTLQYMMPSYPLLALLTARGICRIRFGSLFIFLANIRIWVFMCIFMSPGIFGSIFKFNYPEPLTKGQEDTVSNSMFYPTKSYYLSARVIKDYFKNELAGKNAALYGFLVPKAVMNRSYFDELLMEGIIQPGTFGSRQNPCYTDRKKKEECLKKIYLIFTYKYTENSISADIGGKIIYLDRGDLEQVKKLLKDYRCRVIKEFYLPRTDKIIMTVVYGEVI